MATATTDDRAAEDLCGRANQRKREILQHVFAIHQAAGGLGTWVLDRGADRRELLLPLLKRNVGFIVRQRGDRHVQTEGGRTQDIEELAQEIYSRHRPRRWPQAGWTQTVTVRLPEASEHELLLVLHWKRGDSKPLLLLVSPAARLPGRSGAWFVKAYHRRWGVEDATWGIKQRFHLEQFLVRSWRSIRRLIALVALAFYWLNLWGDDSFQSLREAFLRHRWRLPKEVTYLFDWLATQIQLLLHPKPKITTNNEKHTG